MQAHKRVSFNCFTTDVLCAMEHCLNTKQQFYRHFTDNQ